MVILLFLVLEVVRDAFFQVKVFEKLKLGIVIILELCLVIMKIELQFIDFILEMLDGLLLSDRIIFFYLLDLFSIGVTLLLELYLELLALIFELLQLIV